jgi:regulator of PEP synthase PpsR (kinase-PPPase family)
VDPARVFCLLLDPVTLVEIRRTRMKHLGMDPGAGYGDLKAVRDELAWSRDVFAKHPQWTVLDITGKAIEETAAGILERWRARFEVSSGGSAPAGKAT